MKNLFLILFSIFTIVSCSNSEDETSFDINGQFTDNLIECSGISIEQNCVKFISFIDDSEVYILYEGDIILKRIYQIKGTQITTKKQFENDLEISFKIIDETTLKRIQDNAIFKKESI